MAASISSISTCRNRTIRESAKAGRNTTGRPGGAISLREADEPNMPPRDLILAARTLRKSPVFTATTVLTLALGIGASTAIFSVTNTVLLRPIPYRDPGRLVFATVDLKQRSVRDFPVSNADFFDLRSSANGFEDVAAVATSGPIVMVRDDGTPEQIRYVSVTPNMLRLLGGKIAFGRDFIEADGEPPPDAAAPGAAPPPRPPVVAVLSYEYFQRRYGGNTRSEE